MQILRRTILVVLGVIWLIPVYLMIANAMKDIDQYGTVNVWLPGASRGSWRTSRTLGRGAASPTASPPPCCTPSCLPRSP
ncbi:hypothetical protein [Tessaracoccus coleopterorum]|uniref:hypothetical protein n=1 Tax=Tessaracoccus coleopterorum TaxID=2714950 RepID=UPI0018D4AC59|nr:hypothetical protein [Tessaracoccus coleopterorum]